MKVTKYSNYYKDSKNKIPHDRLANSVIVLGSVFGNKKRTFVGFKTFTAAYKFILSLPLEERGYSEVLAGKVKPFIDFDLKDNDLIEFKSILDKHSISLERVGEKIREAVVYAWKITSGYSSDVDSTRLFDSTREDKISFHAHLEGYFVENPKILRDSFLGNLRDYFRICWATRGSPLYPRDVDVGERLGELCANSVDDSVYSKLKLMRAYLNYKPGRLDSKKRFVRNDSGKKPTLTDIFISKIPDSYIEYKLPPRSTQLTSVKSEVVELDGYEIGTIRVLVSLLSADRAENYNSWIEVGFALHNSIPDQDGLDLFLEFSSKAGNYDEGGCVDFWERLENTKSNNPLTVASLYHWAKEDNPELFLKKIQSPSFEKRKIAEYSSPFLSKFKVPKVSEEDSSKLSPLDSNCSYLVKSYLGTGKTYQMMQQPEFLDKTKSVLVFSNRRSLAREFEKKFDGNNIKNYLNLRKHEMFQEGRIIVSLESLRFIDTSTPFDLVLIDEVESILSIFSSSTLGKGEKYSESVKAFIELLTKAKRFMAFDAFLTNRSIYVFKELRPDFTLHINHFTPKPRKRIELRYSRRVPDSNTESGYKIIKLEAITRKFIECVKEGKKIYFFSTNQSFLQLKLEPILKQLQVTYLAYYGQGKNGNSASLPEFDANLEWRDVQVVLTTSTITTGVSYDNIPENRPFDLLFAVMSGQACVVRDIFQSLARPRALKDKILYYSVVDKTFPRCKPRSRSRYYIEEQFKADVFLETLKSKNVEINSVKWLQELKYRNEVEIQLGSANLNSLRQILNLYFDFCGYTTGDLEEDDETEVELPDLEVEEETLLEFNSVPNVTHDEYTTLLELKKKHALSVLEFTKLKKYEFVNKYFEGVVEEALPYVALLFDDLYIHKENPKLSSFINTTRQFKKDIPDRFTQSQEVDWTDPTISSIVKIATLQKLADSLSINVASSGIINLEALDNLTPDDLRSQAEKLFNYRDRRKKKETPPENFLLVRHIFSNSFGAKLSKESKSTKLNGKVKRVSTHVSYTPHPLLGEQILKYIK